MSPEGLREQLFKAGYIADEDLASLVWMALKAIVEILEFQADLGNQEKKEIVAPQV